MSDIICFVSKYKDLAEFLSYVIVIPGVFIAVISLRNAKKELTLNTIAQQDLMSPKLILSFENDLIGGCYIENVGNLLARNIRIDIKFKPLHDKGDISILVRQLSVNDKLKLIPITHETNAVQEIDVNISYESPSRDRIRYVNEKVSRNEKGNQTKNRRFFLNRKKK